MTIWPHEKCTKIAEFVARFKEPAEGFLSFPFKIYGIGYARVIRFLSRIVKKEFLVNAKGHSQFAQDLDRLHQRIQENKKTLHESKIKAQNLNASLQTVIQHRQSSGQKQKAYK
jgi:hypothetical protein